MYWSCIDIKKEKDLDNLAIGLGMAKREALPEMQPTGTCLKFMDLSS